MRQSLEIYLEIPIYNYYMHVRREFAQIKSKEK